MLLTHKVSNSNTQENTNAGNGVYKSLEDMYLSVPGVFNYSATGNIQFATKAFTIININLEIIASNPECRKIVLDKLLNETNNYEDIDYFCGIESGGSYFASALADKHNKKLILLRRTDKIEDVPTSRIAGEIPPKGSRICFVDDVLSTGYTLSSASKFLKDLGCILTEAKIIYSYGYHKEIGRRLKLNIATISEYSNLIRLAKDRELVTDKDVKKINKYIRSFKNFLAIHPDVVRNNSSLSSSPSR